MAIFGLGTKAAKTTEKKQDKTAKKDSTKSDNSKQSAEAKAMLDKMAAKKDAGDCPFC